MRTICKTIGFHSRPTIRCQGIGIVSITIAAGGGGRDGTGRTVFGGLVTRCRLLRHVSAESECLPDNGMADMS